MTKWAQLFLPLILLTSSALANDAIPATAKQLTQFVVMGDMPYTDIEYALLEQPDGAIATAIKALNPAVLIHLGDFKKGRLSCSDELLKDQATYLKVVRANKINNAHENTVSQERLGFE